MPQETKAILHESEHKSPQGLTATADDPVALRKAIELALDYRGDVTIRRRTSRFAATQHPGGGAIEPTECFIFDIRESKGIHIIRAIPRDSDEKVAIPFTEIESITFTGRDTAAGKSFDTWMKNYVKKKLAGEEASIHSDLGE